MERMKELVHVLNKAAEVYYQGKDEVMSNLEYDKLYDELSALEEKTGIILSNSPTVRVGYEVLSELPKERHQYPILSLDKTKSIHNLTDWLGDNTGVLSWKLDGLTVVVTYENGILSKAVTRGNGEIGEVITNNAKTFCNLPMHINYSGKLVVRGEALIKYSDFERINAEIENPEAWYKNPRNLCSGTVRQLNNEITASRNVHYLVHGILYADIKFKSRMVQMNWLMEQGFSVAEYKKTDKHNISDRIQEFEKEVQTNDFPSDGLVLALDDLIYGESLGSTSKFPRDSMAFKWKDETMQTTLREIEWSASRTGLINPVAIFDPVELEGTTVSRASVHNLSLLEQLELGIGDTIEVYKANMIIPQIAENITRSSRLKIPEKCPVCGEGTIIRQENGVKTLCCVNNTCLAKQIKSLTHFVSRNAMNIDGLSEATIEKFVAKGMIKVLADLFHLKQYEDEIIQMEGFGQKSYDNLIRAIERARLVPPAKFLYSLGIAGIGLANAKLILNTFQNDFSKVARADKEELLLIGGIGEVLADAIIDYFSREENKKNIEVLLKEIEFEKEDIQTQERILDGKVVVITGYLERFENREKLKEAIEAAGGKVTASVTGKTNYLVNNDSHSNSAKNKKAKDLGVEIVTEEQFLDKFPLLW